MKIMCVMWSRLWFWNKSSQKPQSHKPQKSVRNNTVEFLNQTWLYVYFPLVVQHTKLTTNHREVCSYNNKNKNTKKYLCSSRCDVTSLTVISVTPTCLVGLLWTWLSEHISVTRVTSRPLTALRRCRADRSRVSLTHRKDETRSIDLHVWSILWTDEERLSHWWDTEIKPLEWTHEITDRHGRVNLLTHEHREMKK